MKNSLSMFREITGIKKYFFIVSDDVKDILTEIGYTLRDCGNEYRTKPLYRDSD